MPPPENRAAAFFILSAFFIEMRSAEGAVHIGDPPPQIPELVAAVRATVRQPQQKSGDTIHGERDQNARPRGQPRTQPQYQPDRYCGAQAKPCDEF